MKSDLKILIAGAHGFVGARAMEHYKTVIPVDSKILRNGGEPLSRVIKEHHPDVILNAAAISDIGTCEKNPEDSYKANVLLPVTLAETAEEVGAKLIAFSSDQVYTGCREEGPYWENMVLPEPANLYARHKLEAEERVLEICPDSIMLRATWMYDVPIYGYANRGNFLVNTLNAAMRNAPIQASSRQYRGITYVRQVVELLDQVFALPGGVYNYGSENPLNMVETTQALLRQMGLSYDVQDTKQDRHNLWMDCGKLRENGICFDSTAEGFKRCIGDYDLRSRP